MAERDAAAARKAMEIKLKRLQEWGEQQEQRRQEQERLEQERLAAVTKESESEQ